MDERTKQAFEAANLMAVVSNQKQILKAEYEQKLVHYEAGGTFTITKLLLAHVKLLLDHGCKGQTVLVDDNDIPVSINSLEEFFEKIMSVYFFETNEYYNKYTQLVNKRKIESIIDLYE